MIASRIVFFGQLLVLLPAFAILVATKPDFHMLGVLMYVAIVGVVGTVFAVWLFFMRPAERRWAGAIAATPWVISITPLLLTSLIGGPLNAGALAFIVVAGVAIGSFTFMAKTKLWATGGRFANKRFNLGFLAVLGGLLTLYWSPIILWLYNQDTLRRSNISSQNETLLQFGFYFFAVAAGCSLMLALFTLLYAPVGLVRNAGGRLVHTGQLLLALAILASLAIGGFAVGAMMSNPG